MTQFTAVDPVLAALLMAVAVAAGLLRAWITHRTAVRTEEEHTQRTRIAVEGSAPAHRAAVVRACADLEAASRARSKSMRGLAPRRGCN
ncbi:hypothetical protein AB0L71_10260 [Streptomyces sp. NPDC052052]|uniref:hypothetical protein n=1 Tax=Streptomyces sp. NPDC052052 TaxID=3154756 RepID=UPI00342B8155